MICIPWKGSKINIREGFTKYFIQFFSIKEERIQCNYLNPSLYSLFFSGFPFALSNEKD